MPYMCCGIVLVCVDDVLQRFLIAACICVWFVCAVYLVCGTCAFWCSKLGPCAFVSVFEFHFMSLSVCCALRLAALRCML